MTPESPESPETAPEDPLAAEAALQCAEDGPLGIPHPYSLGEDVFVPRDEAAKLSGVIAAERERLNRELAPRLAKLAQRAVAAALCCRDYVEACAELEVESRLRLAEAFETAADALGSGAFAGTFAVPEFVFDSDDLASGRTSREDLRDAVLKERYGTQDTLLEHLQAEFHQLCPNPPPEPAPVLVSVPELSPEEAAEEALEDEETLEADDACA